MTIALMLMVVLLMLWGALRFLPAGAEGHLPLPYLIALIPFLWIPAVLLVLAAIAVGDWWIAGIAAVFAVIVILRVPLYRHHLNRETSRETYRTVTVMTLNCRYGRADAAAIVDTVRSRRVDVLALQELTQNLVAALDDVGIRESLPHRQLGEDRPTDNGGFNGLWTRFVPDATATSAVDIPAADVPMIVTSLTYNERSANDASSETDAHDHGPGGRPADHNDTETAVAFVSAHTKSPMRGCRAWSQGIIGLGRLALRHCGESDTTHALTGETAVSAVVALGDLNCGIDHPSFRRLLTAGFRDASMSAMNKPSVSFPSWLLWPRIELDHVLLSGGIDAEHIETFTIPGSDHLATVAILATTRRVAGMGL